MRDKYANKSRLGQILHRNTGYIIVGIVVPILIWGWITYDESQVYFESYPCIGILAINSTTLTELEITRYNEIKPYCDSMDVDFAP